MADARRSQGGKLREPLYGEEGIAASWRIAQELTLDFADHLHEDECLG